MRKTFKKTNFKSNNGITLIALVITIIVLLILAGVAISMLSGENGIITKAQFAAQEQERANIQDLTIAGYYYKLIAATQDFKYLDMDKTAQGIYANLTNNGYKLKDTTGAEITSAENLLSENKELISLNVKGNHGEYTGEVTNTGLTKDIEIVEPTPELPSEPTPEPPQGPSITYNKKYICVDQSSMKGLDLMFFEDGSAEGSIIMPAGTPVTWEIKSHTANINGIERTFPNACFANVGGAGSAFFGFFNEEYTELKILAEQTPDENGVYSDSWMTFLLEGVELGIENVIYENEYFQLVLYKNGMFTLGYTYYNTTLNESVGQFTGVYEYNKESNELNIDAICDDINIQGTFSEDLGELTATCDDSMFAGKYSRNESKINSYKYNPKWNEEKGIFTNAIYVNNSKSNAISIGSEYICLVQSGKKGNLLDTGNAIKISSFDKATNTTISVSNEGKTIEYNGDVYTLVTLEDMNTASN